jgi:hypothetical protein
MMRIWSEDARKRLLYLRLFVGRIFIVVGFLWLGSEVLRWLKHGHWDAYSILDVIDLLFPTAVLKLIDWLYEPHSWFGLHKLLDSIMIYIYRAFLFTPFSAIVILIGGGLCDNCSNKLGKIKRRDEEIQEKLERMRRKKRRSSLSPGGKKDERHYARTLGINEPATVNDVKRCYKKLVSQYHPDKVDHLGPELQKVAAQKSREINEAYEYFKKKYRIS